MYRPVKIDYAYEQVTVRREFLERVMGYKDSAIPEAVSSELDRILDEARQNCTIKAGYVVTREVTIPEPGIIMAGYNEFSVHQTEFSTGKTISGALKSAEMLAFFLVTIGDGMENWSRQMIEKGDPLSAYIIDLLGSELVEQAAELVQSDLEKKMMEKGFQISNRYSPGYCGWDVSEQKKLFSYFPENFCNIRLTESSLMVPIKSVSGVIGIGSGIRKKDYGCEICDAVNCIYRDIREYG
jgi:hypothetical protein